MYVCLVSNEPITVINDSYIIIITGQPDVTIVVKAGLLKNILL